ncbi:uncharacterized protein LOC104435579 [Eucalyptus grandis]|uniref:uncharacterized protein LOC104435579 n=1 Tax=Eucalyptus grandis TaxID=71139 RepID=UPI00192E9025|nr:uncharacterized protein LOC104435579 [Eucalyptus grandis]
MHVTRPLSVYWKHPEALSEDTPAGPGSGYLEIQDEEAQNFCCFGLCKDSQLYDFPQNKDLTVRYSDGEDTYSDEVFTIPVVGQPLSSKQYYVIQRHAKHKGFSGFHAKSVAPDGYPPRFLKRRWTLNGKTPKNIFLDDDAPGVNDSQRSKLPSLEFLIDRKSSNPVVVRKWYCPVMFIKDGEVGDQITTFAFYETTLQQRWEQVHTCDSYASECNAVEVDMVVQKKAITVFGEEAGEGDASDGMTWQVI